MLGGIGRFTYIAFASSLSLSSVDKILVLRYYKTANLFHCVTDREVQSDEFGGLDAFNGLIERLCPSAFCQWRKMLMGWADSLEHTCLFLRLF